MLFRQILSEYHNKNKKKYTYKNYQGNENKYESKNPYKYLKIKKDSLIFISGGSFASFYKLTLQKHIFSSKKIIGLRVFKDEHQEILSSPIQYYLQRQSSNNKECKNSVCRIIDYGKINKDYLYTMLELGIFTLTNFYNILYINDKNYKEKILLLHFEIIITILKKIKCIHKQKILHLDIKPDNIVIFDGTKDDYDIMIDDNLYNNVFKERYNCSQYIIIKFIDFGIAKVMKKYNRYIIEKKLFQNNKYKFKDSEEMVLLKKEKVFGTLDFMPQIESLRKEQIKKITNKDEINNTTKIKNNDFGIILINNTKSIYNNKNYLYAFTEYNDLYAIIRIFEYYFTKGPYTYIRKLTYEQNQNNKLDDILYKINKNINNNNKINISSILNNICIIEKTDSFADNYNKNKFEYKHDYIIEQLNILIRSL